MLILCTIIRQMFTDNYQQLSDRAALMSTEAGKLNTFPSFSCFNSLGFGEFFSTNPVRKQTPTGGFEVREALLLVK